MRNFISFFCLVLTTTSFSQEWVIIPEENLMDNLNNPPLEMTVDKTFNNVWFTTKTKIFGLGESFEDYVYLPGLGLSSVDHLVAFNGAVWWPTSQNDVTGKLYSYTGGSPVLEATLMNRLLTIELDNEDSLWIGSTDDNSIGVHAFKDGNYVFYSDANSPLTNEHIYQAFEDSYGRKWLTHYHPMSSTENGVRLWDMSTGTSTFYSYYLGHNLPQFNKAVKVNQSDTGTIYLACSMGLFRYDEVGEDWIAYNLSNTNMPSEYISDIQFDKSGKLWAMFLDTALAYTYNLVDWTIFDENNSPLTFGQDGIKSFTIDTLDNIWTGDENNLYIFNINSVKGWAGVKSNDLDSIYLYPNPFEHEITLKGINSHIDFEIEIYNLSGELVYFSKNQNHIDNLDSIPKGTYIIYIQSEKIRKVKKIVKI